MQMDISKHEILESVRKSLTPDQIEGSLIFWYKRIFQKNEQINIGPQTFAMPFEGTIVFVDLAPRANWAHPCLYLCVEIKTLTTKIIEASLPPRVDQSDNRYIIILHFGKEPPNERFFSIFDE
jgi:hypothetical protein